MTLTVYLREDKEVIRGDDYETAISREIDWDITDTTLPDLTSATVTFTRGTFSKVMTVTSPSSLPTLTLELTDTETTDLECRKDFYNIKGVLSGGQIITIANGNFIVRDDI